MKNSRQYGSHRFLEIIPGALVWTTFFLAVTLSFLWPLGVVVFVIIFDLLWLFRVLYFIVHVFFAWRRYRRERSIDWLKELQRLPDWRRVHHLIFLPTFKESYEIVRSALEGLRRTAYPKDRMIVCLAGEEADRAAFERHARRLSREYGEHFLRFLVTVHPSGLSGEIPGKGSNLNWSARQIQPIIEAMGINPDDIVVSAFDIDTSAHQQYFARLSHLFLTVPDPTHSSYQPITLFSNNVWQASAPVRIGSFGTTFWLFSELVRSERLWTFSSHSMPWRMLLDVGFWEKDMISEDSRIFLQALIHYHGHYRVTPIFLPVSMDAVAGRTYFGGLRALYRQQRRWAWGVEHFPYMVSRFCRDRLMPRRVKIKYIFNHLEGMYTWATAPILIFILGYLPLFVSRQEVSALVRGAPFTLEWVMRLASLGVLFSALLSLTLLPRRPQEVRKTAWVIMLLQWALLPITFVIFGSLPAIDAQTRLMLGRYLGFQVTKKLR